MYRENYLTAEFIASLRTFKHTCSWRDSQGMASERQFTCQMETRKMVWLLGLVFASLLLAEYLELPYGCVMSSLLSAAQHSFNSGISDGPRDVAGLAVHPEAEVAEDKNGEQLKSPLPTNVRHTEEREQQRAPPSTTSGIPGAPPHNDSAHIVHAPHNDSAHIVHASSVSKVPATNCILRKPTASAVSIAEMHNTLLQNQRCMSPLSIKPLWSSSGDQDLLHAKSQIENAPAIWDNQGLYSPLYRNISSFIRSYELMEQMLKVYIYSEGKKPVFHQPRLTGIYASEGWFLKLLEASKHYVTRDPEEAHLFYLPFTSQMLEEALYVRNSHSFDNLIRYLKDYLDLIKARYTFWNRTSGADHFLVGCHDWAPYETKWDMVNCIRALCNADLKEGFQLGKDVSLPETLVHSAQDPSKDTGGKSPSQRHILAFFAGQMHGYVRPILLKHWQNKDPDMQIYGRMRQSDYSQHMMSSKYCLCPRGYEVNSPRVVEAILHGCVPVIISDNFVPPFFEILNWESFAVFVLEKDIPNLKRILASISERRYLVMQYRVKRVRQHFLWHETPQKFDIFHMILHSIWYNRVFQMNS